MPSSAVSAAAEAAAAAAIASGGEDKGRSEELKEEEGGGGSSTTIIRKPPPARQHGRVPLFPRVAGTTTPPLLHYHDHITRFGVAMQEWDTSLYERQPREEE
jgi:hypothetical protein